MPAGHIDELASPSTRRTQRNPSLKRRVRCLVPIFLTCSSFRFRCIVSRTSALFAGVRPCLVDVNPSSIPSSVGCRTALGKSNFPDCARPRYLRGVHGALSSIATLLLLSSCPANSCGQRDSNSHAMPNATSIRGRQLRYQISYSSLSAEFVKRRRTKDFSPLCTRSGMPVFPQRFCRARVLE